MFKSLKDASARHPRLVSVLDGRRCHLHALLDDMALPDLTFVTSHNLVAPPKRFLKFQGQDMIQITHYQLPQSLVPLVGLGSAVPDILCRGNVGTPTMAREKHTPREVTGTLDIIKEYIISHVPGT